MCSSSEASAILPGPAGAKAISVSNFLSWTAHLVWSPISNKKQKSTKIILGRRISMCPHRQIRRYLSNADMNATCMTLLEHCRRPSTPNRPSHCSTASVSGHFFAHCVLQSTKVSWTQKVAFSKAMRCTEASRSSSCMSSRSSSCKNDSRSGKQQWQQ